MKNDGSSSRGFCPEHGILLKAVGRIEGKLDTTIESFKEWRNETKSDIALLRSDVQDKLETTQEVGTNAIKRIGKLEKWKWYIGGGAAVLLFIATQVPNIIKLVGYFMK